MTEDIAGDSSIHDVAVIGYGPMGHLPTGLPASDEALADIGLVIAGDRYQPPDGRGSVGVCRDALQQEGRRDEADWRFMSHVKIGLGSIWDIQQSEFRRQRRDRTRIPRRNADHWRRLREVKTTYDPTNVFRHNANTPPIAQVSA